MNTPMQTPVIMATRGSALALAQAELVLAECRRYFPEFAFQIRIIKTTGDRLQTASLATTVGQAAKGLFTKELELALLRGKADLAVHSLKDLPTDLPPGLRLGAVCPRADVRDVLIYRAAQLPSCPLVSHAPASAGAEADAGVKRGFAPGLTLQDLPVGATVATSSTRRQAQLLAWRPDLTVVPMRGNVNTRLRKLMNQPALDALILAAAGLGRLGYTIDPTGHVHQPPSGANPSGNTLATPTPSTGLFQAPLKTPTGGEVGRAVPSAPLVAARKDRRGEDTAPYQMCEVSGLGTIAAAHFATRSPDSLCCDGLLASFLEPEVMLPCVGQGAIGIEIRNRDERAGAICERLNHDSTFQCVLAERAFLRAMGGGCQSPVAAYAEPRDDQIRLRAVSFRDGPARWAERSGDMSQASALGEAVAAQLGAPAGA